MNARYAELQVTSHFSFLRGASSCEELFAYAANLGIEALAVADRNSLAGIVRAHEAAKVTGVRLIVGCRLDLTDGMSVLAQRYRVPTVVTNDVLFHEASRRILQDVVTCIRHTVTIDEAGFLRERHADRYLKPPAEMARLFSRYPEAVGRTIEISNRCTFSLDELVYQYPEERTMPGLTPQQALEKLTWEGVAER
jgi:DNA polymerase III alpha subunit